MKATDIQDIWRQDNLAGDLHSEQEIFKMLRDKTSGVTRKIRNKLVIEVLLYIVLTYAFVDLFDAFDNGLYVVLFAGILILTGIVNNVALYRFMNIKVESENVREFLVKSVKRLKRQLYFRMIFFCLFIFSMLLILLPSNLSSFMDTKKGIIFVGVAVFSVGVKLVFENQTWKEHIKNLSTSLKELEEE